MKRVLTSLFMFACFVISGSIYGNCSCHPNDYSFYIKASSGISFSESAKVSAPFPTWNEALQGYNSKLGNRAIAGLSLGCEINRLVDIDVGISYRPTFKYRKFQTPVDGGDSYKREFDLDVMPFLLSINLLGRDIPCLNWSFCYGNIYPIIGAGVGVSSLLVTNFRTTELPPSGDSSPFLSFSAENQYTSRKNFTYTAQVGFEYNYEDRWAVSTGYRWLDAGRFKGPRFQRLDTGAAVDLAGQEWKMDFKANEWFIEFKIFM